MKQKFFLQSYFSAYNIILNKASFKTKFSRHFEELKLEVWSEWSVQNDTKMPIKYHQNIKTIA